MKSLTVSDHALVVTKLAILRAKTTAPDEFRRTLQDLTALLFAEASRSWETRAIEIETPLTRCRGERAIQFHRYRE